MNSWHDETYDCIIVAQLCHYMEEPQKHWDTYFQQLTYAYSTQTARATGNSAFIFILSHEPPSAVNLNNLSGSPTEIAQEARPITTKQRLWHRVNVLKTTVGHKLTVSENQCKKDFDKKLRQYHVKYM